MPTKDSGTGGGGRRPTTGTPGRNRNAYCSFCRKGYLDVGPLVEGPGDVYICGECIELCQSIIDQEKRRRQGGNADTSTVDARQIRQTLDRLVDGQEVAKETLVDAGIGRHDKSRRVLLFGPSRASRLLLSKALADALKVPFVAGGSGIFHRLFAASDFNVDSFQNGVVYVEGVRSEEAQQALSEIWLQDCWKPASGVELNVRSVLFICGDTFAALEQNS